MKKIYDVVLPPVQTPNGALGLGETLELSDADAAPLLQAGIIKLADIKPTKASAKEDK